MHEAAGRNQSITRNAIRLAWRNVARANPMHLVGPDSIVHRCASSSGEQCYGEPTFVGLRKLYQCWPTECAVDSRSSFYDVGSGFGRLSAFMRVHTNASRVRGIEINECRHRSALALLESVQRELPSAGELDFLSGDVQALGLGDATHAFLAAQCWGEALLVDVLRKALAAPRLRCLVVLSRKLPEAWTTRVDALAAAFGHVVAVNEVPTTYRGASAIFFRRGRCVDVDRGSRGGAERGDANRGGVVGNAATAATFGRAGALRTAAASVASRGSGGGAAARLRGGSIASRFAERASSPLDSPYRAGRRPTCWPMQEVVLETERHAKLIVT